MTHGGNGFGEPPRSRTAVARRPDPYDDPDEDVIVARRGAASFGGGDPTFGDLLRDFVRRYGWRAYALPILVVVTIAALMTARTGAPPKTPTPAAGNGGGSTAPADVSQAPPVAKDGALPADDPGTGSVTPLKTGQLPAGPAYTVKGDGSFTVLKGTSAVVGTGTLHRYDVEVEGGITGVDTAYFAKRVQTVLSDPRSWSGHGIALQRVDSGPVDFHVSLTSAMTVRTYCGYTIHVETSCYAGAGTVGDLTVNRVFLNVARWMRGAAPYVGDIEAYRTYMINHEDGHALGHRHAHQCLSDGLAPVMMQQTFGLQSATTDEICQANPWPFPPGAKGTPGAEQADTDQNNEYNLGD